MNLFGFMNLPLGGLTLIWMAADVRGELDKQLARQLTSVPNQNNQKYYSWAIGAPASTRTKSNLINLYRDHLALEYSSKVNG